MDRDLAVRHFAVRHASSIRSSAARLRLARRSPPPPAGARDEPCAVGVLEPGKVDTEPESQNNEEIRANMEANFGGFRMLDPKDIADGIAYGHPPAHAAIGELWIMPTEQG